MTGMIDGVHVIHQLTAAGRTLVAILINCHAESLRPLIQPSLEALRSWGCETAQGYHIARPMPAAEFLAWLTARREAQLLPRLF